MMDDFFEQYGDLLGNTIQEHKNGDNEAFFSLNQDGTKLLAERMGSTVRQAMLACLDCGIWPLRFRRNRGVLNAGEQARLLRCHAALLGCGGLGGCQANFLARLGIGSLTICDHDIFTESNLNRQSFCREDCIGMPKAIVAKNELMHMASHMQINSITYAASRENLPQILDGADIAIDCLDNFASRMELGQAAAEAGIPLVHGAIAGYEGFVFQGSKNTNCLQALCHGSEQKGAENRAGVPVFTVVSVAAMQTLMLMHLLLGKAEMDPACIWHLDLSVPEVELLFF